MRKFTAIIMVLMVLVCTPALSENYTTIAGQTDTYYVKALSATVGIPEGYDVFSKDNPVSNEVLNRHNFDRSQYEMLVSMYDAELWMFPMNEEYPTSFKISIRVKEKESYSLVGDLRKRSQDDLTIIAEFFWQDMVIGSHN